MKTTTQLRLKRRVPSHRFVHLLYQASGMVKIALEQPAVARHELLERERTAALPDGYAAAHLTSTSLQKGKAFLVTNPEVRSMEQVDCVRVLPRLLRERSTEHGSIADGL